MEYTNMSFLYDFAFMSLLLIIAQFLRSRIKFCRCFIFQRLFWQV